MTMELPDTKRKYTSEEKKQLLANLDIEVKHRVRQFEAWLADTLENFRIHQEGQVSRVPKLVRGLTMRDFGEKYNGDIQTALRGMQREKLGGADIGEIDKGTRKRKWVASQEAEAAAAAAAQDTEGSRNPKNARMMSTSPKKKPGSSTGPGTAQRARLVSSKTPGASRTMGRVPPSPSPAKPNRGPAHPHLPSRPASPSKPNRATRPPSTSTFNPLLPKTPGYPSSALFPGGAGTARAPRRHESMLSINGSPIANPYELGLEWFAEGGDTSPEEDNGSKAEEGRRKRAKSIIVRRDPSFSFQSAPLPNGMHSRTASQTNLFASSSQSTEPASQPEPKTPHGPTTLRLQGTGIGIGTALVTIPTKDGHLLEFDPLQTSPGTLDALEGISDSAKKQAKEEMGRLVLAAVSKWKIA